VTRVYGADLSFIHDAGFTGFARRAAPGLLASLRRAGIARGRVVDLGCGSGVWAAALGHAGYDVFGIDQSASMIALARQRVPRGRFRRAGFARGAISACDAITALGECFNYRLGASDLPLRALFGRAARALRPGGVLMFDALLPASRPAVARGWSEGKGWAVLVETRCASPVVLTRRIVTYRRTRKGYRRGEEVHRLRLYPAATLAAWLARAGFRVRSARGYGRYRLSRDRIVFIARRA